MDSVERKDKMEELFTTKEVAKICKVKPDTVWKWTRTGQLPYVIVGARTKRIKKSDLEAFQKRKAGKEASK